MNAIFIKTLVDGPHSRYDLCDETGLSYKTVCDYVDALHRHKLIYIAAIVEDNRNRNQIEQFQWGPGQKDATRKPVSRAVINQRVRDRHRDIAIHQALAGKGVM